MRRPMRELPTEVRALVVVAFMVALGFGVVAPAIPLFAREFGVSKTAASAVISAFALMRLVTAPFVGRLVDALGERVVLASGIGIVAVSSLLAGLAQAYWQLLVLRGAGGVGSIMFSVSAASILVRVAAQPPARARPGRVGGRVPARDDRRTGGRHGRRVVAAGPVLPLRRDAGRRRSAGAGHAAAQRPRRAADRARGPGPAAAARCADAPISPRWLRASPATSRSWARARRSCPSSSHDRLRLGSSWVYARLPGRQPRQRRLADAVRAAGRHPRPAAGDDLRTGGRGRRVRAAARHAVRRRADESPWVCWGWAGPQTQSHRAR